MSTPPRSAAPSAHDDARLLERDLLQQWADMPVDDPRRASVREALVVVHQPLIRSLARRYEGRGEPLDDLIQAASIGLLKAIDRYDADRSDSLAALIVPYALGEIRRHFRDRTWSVRVPRGLQELAMQTRAAQGELEQSLGRSPTVHEIAQKLDVDPEDVLDALEAAAAYRTDSVDESLHEGEGGGIRQVRADDTALEQVLQREALRPALAELTARERAILQLRFVEQRTQSEIADALGVDQSQVSRVLARTLVQLRQRLGEHHDLDGSE